jgi:hypothetical protein
MKNSIDPGSAHLREGRAALNRGAWDAAREAFEAALAESNRHGSLKTSGWWRKETWEKAPVPSRQIIPAPIPPMGKATRRRFSSS